MIRSTIRAGTGALLSIAIFAPAAAADATLTGTKFITPAHTQSSEMDKNHPRVRLASGVPFADVLKSAQSHPNAYIGEVWISELLSDDALTSQQQARTLYARAQHRWKKSSNRVGAWQDFSQFTKLYPDDLYATNAGIEARYVETEITRIETRMEELQTLSAWFADAWALGLRDEAAARYKRSGFLPEPVEIDQLKAAGYICDAPSSGVPKGYTAVTQEAQTLYWCG